MSPLSNEERVFLLRLARQVLQVRLVNSPVNSLPPDIAALSGALQAQAGVFVSLHKSGALRGCVGTLEPRLPLYRTVMDIAIAAAIHDPRFAPVGADELSEIDVEISVLSQPLPIAVAEIRIGLHGLIVSQGPARGLLLPQVALERHWSPERFLEETCHKAGLERDAWRNGAQIEAFLADVFGEKQGVPEGTRPSLL